MYKLKFLLRHYSRPFYGRLAAAALAGLVLLAGAASTPYLAPVGWIVGLGAGAVAATAATLAILVLNVMIASDLGRRIDRFEAAYDTYRRANGIVDIFYEEADLAEAAANKA